MSRAGTPGRPPQAHLKLHPLIVLIVLVMAEHALGVWGLLLAVPLSGAPNSTSFAGKRDKATACGACGSAARCLHTAECVGRGAHRGCAAPPRLTFSQCLSSSS